MVDVVRAAGDGPDVGFEPFRQFLLRRRSAAAFARERLPGKTIEYQTRKGDKSQERGEHREKELHASASPR